MPLISGRRGRLPAPSSSRTHSRPCFLSGRHLIPRVTCFRKVHVSVPVRQRDDRRGREGETRWQTRVSVSLEIFRRRLLLRRRSRHPRLLPRFPSPSVAGDAVVFAANSFALCVSRIACGSRPQGEHRLLFPCLTLFCNYSCAHCLLCCVTSLDETCSSFHSRVFCL